MRSGRFLFVGLRDRSFPTPSFPYRTSLSRALLSSSALPRRGPWRSLDESKRSAWEALGWDQDRWEGRRAPPPSSLSSWTELSSAQQAAAMYGLGYTHQQWDSLIPEGSWLVRVREENKEAGSKPTLRNNVEASPKSVRAASTMFGKNVVGRSGSTSSTVGKWVRSAANFLAPSMVDAMSDPVVVNGVETSLYLDDSPSMNESMGSRGCFGSTRLEEAKKVVGSLGPLLQPLPCRILKFSSQPSVLALREESATSTSTQVHVRRDEESSSSSSFASSYAISRWDASGNGTYLWHMIQEDVVKRYRPGTGKLRLIVVTDGEDNMSPSGYQGMRGMDPMMRTLQKKGYDIEWHIVVVGGDTRLERYKDLAGATGGSFLALSDSFDKSSRESRRFLQAVKSSGRTDNDKRRERQRQYELDAKRGNAERFDWYKALPPGNKK